MFPRWLIGNTTLVCVKSNFQLSTSPCFSIRPSLFGANAKILLSITQGIYVEDILDYYISLTSYI